MTPAAPEGGYLWQIEMPSLKDERAGECRMRGSYWMPDGSKLDVWHLFDSATEMHAWTAAAWQAWETSERFPPQVTVLRATLEQWKCPSCGGSKTYTQRSRARGEEIVICKVCNGTGLHPKAFAALYPKPPEANPEPPTPDARTAGINQEHYPMQTITDWTARRAGGRITIKGTDVETLSEVKIVGVDSIHSPGAGRAITAVDHKGVHYTLAV